MTFLPALIPAIGAIASVAGAAVPLISAFRKPPSAPTQRIPNTSALSVQDNRPGLRQSLIQTGPQGVLQQSDTSSGSILGG